MTFSSSSRNNQLLAALPNAVRQEWLQQLEWVFMPLDHVLYDKGQSINHVYFPVTAVVSLIYVTRNGASSGVASVGHEGLVGVEALMGGHSMPGRAVVQNEGYGYRLSAAWVKAAFECHTPTMQLLLMYTHALLVQIAQLAACSRHHRLEKRLSRWLLWQFDHLQTSELSATHGRIAKLLGVRRESVTEGLGKLQNFGVIQCSRGHVSMQNRIGLEEHSCECAHVIKLEYDRLPQGSGILTDVEELQAALHKPRRDTVTDLPVHFAEVIRYNDGASNVVNFSPAAQPLHAADLR